MRKEICKIGSDQALACAMPPRKYFTITVMSPEDHITKLLDQWLNWITISNIPAASINHADIKGTLDIRGNVNAVYLKMI